MGEILRVEDLKKYFATKKGTLHAVDGVTFTVEAGKTLGIVGESGCGKSTLGRVILHLHERTEGRIVFQGEDISDVSNAKLKELRKDMQIIFQDPSACLNPRRTIRQILMEPFEIHHLTGKIDVNARIEELLHLVGLDTYHLSRYPHEMSGGQKQRIGIARALVMEPEFIVADEPISALDVSIRAQVLNLLNSMKKSRGLTYLFIAHDLSVVRFISDRIAVISKGRIVELAEAEELFLHPLHPYTKALLSAVPIPDPGLEKSKKLLVYDPSIHDYSVDKPVWEEIANGHFVYGNQKELEGYRKEYQSQL